MLRRILFATAAAATLLAAAPAFAAEQGEARTQPCSCGSHGSMHHPDGRPSEAGKVPVAPTEKPVNRVARHNQNRQNGAGPVIPNDSFAR